MTRPVESGLVAKDWNADQHKGMITNSVVVFVTRKGNPKNIRTWDDLIKPGVEVIEPNPFTSGGAKWNIMAADGAQLKNGKTPGQAAAYLLELFRHVPVQDKSAREALQTFIGGKGDVMLAYENEAINAQQKQQPVDYVVPDQPILIENPIPVVSKSRHAATAKAFVDFLRSEQAQRIYAAKGYRPVNQAAAAQANFPQPPGLFTIDDLGGWAEVSKRFFDKETGIVLIDLPFVLPTIAPALLAGAALALARAVGEFGSVVILSGNIPYRTEVASVHVFSLVENDDIGSAAAVSVALLAAWVLVLAVLNLIQRRRTRQQLRQLTPWRIGACHTGAGG